MATMMIPSRSARVTLHDIDYHKVHQMIDNARALMAPGQGRAEIRCPICGGTAWVLPEHHNDGQSCIAQCEGGCFVCWE